MSPSSARWAWTTATGLAPSKTEEVKLYPSGNTNYKLKFTNRAGVTYDEEVFYFNGSISSKGLDNLTSTNVSLGDSASKPLMVKESIGEGESYLRSEERRV